MARKMCLKLDEKFVKFEQIYAKLGMAVAEMQLEYANLRAEITRKDDQFADQNTILKNEVAKLKEENRILKARLMNDNNVAEEDEQYYCQNKRSRIEMLPIEEIQQELDMDIGHQQVEITVGHQHLERANNNNEDENLGILHQFVANGNNNGIAIKQEVENTNNDICQGTSQEQLEIEQQIIQHSQNYYLANQMDESADGFDQMEEEIFGEEEEVGEELPGQPKIQIKRRRLDYHEIKRLIDENEFEQWIQGTDWTKDNRGKRIQHYSCKFNRRKGYSCKARLRMFRPFQSNLIRVLESNIEHTHEPIVVLEGPMKLTETAKKFIDEQLILGMTAQEIRNAFEEAYWDHPNDVPDLIQIRNRIQRVRRKNPGLTKNV